MSWQPREDGAFEQDQSLRRMATSGSLPCGEPLLCLLPPAVREQQASRMVGGLHRHVPIEHFILRFFPLMLLLGHWRS